MLRNRQEAEETKLRGVITAGEPDEVELGSFTQLQNWIPSTVYSIKKKRGVAAFTSEAVTPEVPGSQCDACPDDTVPEAQDIPFVYNFEQIGGADGGLDTNTAGQCNYVKPGATEEFIAWVSVRSGFGSAYPASEGTDFEVVHCVGENKVAVTPVPLPAGTSGFTFFGQEAQSGKNGHSDEKSYLLRGNYTNASQSLNNAFIQVYFSYDEGVSYAVNLAANISRWAKRGSNLWAISPLTDPQNIYRFNLPTAHSGAAASRTGTGRHFSDIQATDNFLWAFGSESGVKFWKMNLSTLADVDTYTVTGLPSGYSVVAIYVVSDDLMWLVAEADSGSQARFFIFQPSSSTLTEIDSNVDPHNLNSAAGIYHSLQWASGYLYVTQAGFAGGTWTFKYGPIFCPGTDIVLGA